MKQSINSLQLELHVDDFEKVKKFYALLGFEVVWERKPEGEKGYLVIKNDQDCIINFWSGNSEVYNQPYFKQFEQGTKRGYGVEIVIPVSKDLKELEQTLRVSGAIMAEPLQKRPWGLSDFRCEDPFGYYLRVTTSHDITDSDYGVE